MKSSSVRNATRMAKARAPKPRWRFFWWGDEPYEAVQARIRASIASGEASPHDRFVTFSWRRDEGEGAGD
jgi:hypothetical protein